MIGLGSSLISFAQNYEDVFLERCFADVALGFYIDVGASHPVRDSVTYWFYRRGWCGLNIDASRTAFQLLERYRPRDINVNAIVGDADTEIEFFDSGLSGLSSVSPRLAEQAAKRGFAVNRVSVQGVKLDSLCEKHGVAGIDFFKIDAEGHEPNVLRGFSISRWRPKVVIVEAVDAITAEYSNDESVSLLAAAGYSRVYFDGLNDYFLAPECEHLRRHFASPISVLDGAERWSDYRADAARGSVDAIAWDRIFSSRLRQRWSEFSQEDEIEWECKRLDPSLSSGQPTPAHVHNLYVELLGRVPNADEVQHWLASAPTVRDLVSRIVQSDEYCRKSLEWGGL